MSMNKRRTLMAAAVVTALLGGTGTLGATAASAGTPDALTLPDFSHMVSDGEHLFISGGEGSTGIEVTTPDGIATATIDEPGATSMVLSPDAETLYVALPDADAIAAISTTTFTETARYPLGVSPFSVAFAGGKVWFSYTAQSGALGSIDPAGDGTSAVTLFGSSVVDGRTTSAPLLTSSPAAPNVLVTGLTGSSPAFLQVIDVTSGTPVQGPSQFDGADSLSSMAITPDGEDVVTSGTQYHPMEFQLSDMTSAGEPYDDGGSIGWVMGTAYASDGTFAESLRSGSPDLAVFAPGSSTPAHTWTTEQQDGSGTPDPQGLAWSPDGSRLYEMTHDADGVHTLHVLYDPTKDATSLSVTPPSSPVLGTAYTFTGTLTSPDAFDGSARVAHVVRTDAADPQGAVLSDAPIAADGTFSFSDTAQAAGPATYTVTYDGDATHARAVAVVPVTVAKAATTLTLSAPATDARGSAVTITGHLTSAVALPAGTVVQLTKTNLQHTVTMPSVTVGANGSFSVSDIPYVGGTNTYTATYAGDAAHAPATAKANVSVSRNATSLTVTTGATDYAYDASAQVTAHLGTTYNGRTVSIYAQPWGGTKKLLKTGTVDSHGNLVVNTTMPVNTNFTATFAGDYQYAPVTVSHTAYAYAKVTEVLKGYYTTTLNGSTTYRVYHHTANPVFGAEISPNKSGECVIFTAQTWSDGAWRPLANSGCQTAGSDSSAWVDLTGSHPVGPHFRVRAEFVRSGSGDPNLSTYSSWQCFEYKA